MNQTFFVILGLLSRYFEPRFSVKLQILIYQIGMLRNRTDALKIVPTPRERSDLMRMGERLDHEIEGIMWVVKSDTYKGWVRKKRRGKKWKMVGRPKTPEAICNLLSRMAEGNPRWGHKRIVGELKKLGIRIGATTVRDLLKSMGIFPEPTKHISKGNIPWRTFIEAHKECLLACDFFSKNVWSFFGKRQLYYLAFIHIESRRVFCSAGTYHPNEEWVLQQARNVTMWAEDNGINTRYLIHDRDAKFAKTFTAFWKSENVKCIRTPVRAPMANSYIECWIGTLKKETLNHLICFGQSQTDYIVHTWVEHFNTRRPHRGVGRDNTVLDPNFVPQTEGVIKCKKKLGGLITEWHREAA